MSTEKEEVCIKCSAVVRESEYGWGWEYLKGDRPFHLFKCLHPGEETNVIYED